MKPKDYVKFKEKSLLEAWTARDLCSQRQRLNPQDLAIASITMEGSISCQWLSHGRFPIMTSITIVKNGPGFDFPN